MLNLILLEKYPEQYILYFYQILNFMRNPTKFGSPKLDIDNSTYDFSKFAYILEKCIKIISIAADSWDPRVNRACVSSAQSRVPVLTG